MRSCGKHDQNGYFAVAAGDGMKKYEALAQETQEYIAAGTLVAAAALRTFSAAYQRAYGAA